MSTNPSGTVPPEAETTAIGTRQEETRLRVAAPPPSPPATATSMSKERIRVIVAVVVVVVLAIFALLLGLAFQGVHYYELGFVRSRTTGRVDASKVYSSGIYPVGPQNEFLVFPADAHFVKLEDLGVATSESNSVIITVGFQYRLIKDELNFVREKYNMEYEAFVKSAATEAIKQITPTFSNRDFLLSRRLIEKQLADSIRNKLSSTCCSTTCPEEGYCPAGCVSADSCTAANRREHVEVIGIQLTDMELVEGVTQYYLDSILLDIAEESALLQRNVTLIEADTEVMVNRIELEQEEIRRNATTEAKLVRSRAHAEARRIVQEARIAALTDLFSAADITAVNDKNAINYLRALRTSDGTRLNVNFDSLFRQTGVL